MSSFFIHRRWRMMTFLLIRLFILFFLSWTVRQSPTDHQRSDCNAVQSSLHGEEADEGDKVVQSWRLSKCTHAEREEDEPQIINSKKRNDESREPLSCLENFFYFTPFVYCNRVEYWSVANLLINDRDVCPVRSVLCSLHFSVTLCWTAKEKKRRGVWSPFSVTHRRPHSDSIFYWRTSWSQSKLREKKFSSSRQQLPLRNSNLVFTFVFFFTQAESSQKALPVCFHGESNIRK